MTAGLRSFLGRHRRLGRAARRGVRLIYWTVTLQLATRLRARTQSETVEDESYTRWVDIYDTIDDGDLRALARASSRLGRKPVISVVMPVYETPERLLREAIESVLHQAYDRWELCIADDSSTSPHVKEVLDEYALADSRLKVIRLPEQSGIAKASNAALEQATGEFVALLDHDDLLRPHALLMVASAINDHPEAVFVYSDEDKVNDQGERFVPHFKPDWNPALLLSQNYLCHLSVFRRDRALAVGGFRTGFDGSQDWDLFLRLTRGLDPISIVHIPHVLYHWRAAEGSTAKSGGAKPYALEAGTRAVADHLEAVGAEAEVSTVGTAVLRVLYAVPTPVPAVDVIVPTACTHDHLQRLVEGILGETDYANLRLNLVVNETLHDDRAGAGSPGASARGFAAERDRVCRSAVQLLVGQQLRHRPHRRRCHLPPERRRCRDPPRVARRTWSAICSRTALARWAPMLYYPDDTIQHGGVILGVGGVAGHYHHLLPRGEPGYFGRAWCNQDLSCVTAGCMLLRREAFADVGGFDEALAIAFNDVDLCIRLRQRGWRIVWTPSAELYHFESTSVGRHDSPARAAAIQPRSRPSPSTGGSGRF